MIAYNPSNGNILCNSRTTSGTLLTIPAGQVWCGDLQVSASVAAAATGTPSITVNGTNAEPATGTIVSRLSITGLAPTTVTDSSVNSVIVRAPAENSITLDFSTGGATSAAATATGFLL